MPIKFYDACVKAYSLKKINKIMKKVEVMILSSIEREKLDKAIRLLLSRKLLSENSSLFLLQWGILHLHWKPDWERISISDNHQSIINYAIQMLEASLITSMQKSQG